MWDLAVFLEKLRNLLATALLILIAENGYVFLFRFMFYSNFFQSFQGIQEGLQQTMDVEYIIPSLNPPVSVGFAKQMGLVAPPWRATLSLFRFPARSGKAPYLSQGIGSDGEGG